MIVTLRRLGDPARFIAERRGFPAMSVFQSEEWLTTFFAEAEGAPIHEARLENAQGLAALGYVSGRTIRRPPLIGARAARVMESGLADIDAIYNEYVDLFIHEAAPADTRERIIGAIIEHSRADEIVIANAQPALVEACRRAAAAVGWRAIDHRIQPTYFVDLDAARREGTDALIFASPSIRKRIERARRRYDAEGALVVRVVRPGPDWSESFETLMKLHQDSWRARGSGGAFANMKFASFHRRLALGAPHLVEIVELCLGDRVIASLYNLLHGDRAYNYQSGVRLEADNQLVPGLVAHAAAADLYLERGFSVYDLLAGDARYKSQLARQGDPLTTIVLERANPLRDGLKSCLKMARRVLDRRPGTRHT